MSCTIKRCIYFLSVVVLLLNCKRPFAPSANLKNYNFLFQQNENEFAEKVSATFFGTSTLLFDDGETQIMIDGFLSRPSTFKVAFGKVKTDESFIDEVLTFHDVNRLKGIFVCHSHYDHVMDAPYISQKTGATLYGSSSTINVGKGATLQESLMVEFKDGDKIQLGKFTIEVILSKHTPPFKILGKSNATDPCHPNIIEPLSQPAKSSHFIEGGTFDFYITYDNEKHFMVKASTNYLNGKLINYPTDVFFSWYRNVG
jgi:ribonuclease BN (tRNA processing enzyme)